jgi:hypothetical protein
MLEKSFIKITLCPSGMEGMNKRRTTKKDLLLPAVCVVIVLLIEILPHPVTADTPTLISVSPASKTVSAGQTFSITIACAPGQLIRAYELKISFNPTRLHANSVTEGTIFNGYTTFFNDGTINNNAGTIVDIYGLIQGPGGVINPGSLISVSFTALLTSGSSPIGLSQVGITNATAYVPITVTNGTVILREYTLIISFDGSGSVTKNPNQGTYPYGSVVQLTAVPTTGWTFSSWSGDLTGSTNPTSITMNSNKSITAHFVNSALPQIYNLARTTSVPLDTDPAYGWVNVTCTVTDTVMISQVILRIHTPGGSWNNVSMVAKGSGQYYYRSNTAFSPAGNYNYSIYAKDINNNANTSNTVVFSMPPNWDINSDGECTILDLVLVSNHYGQTGLYGWIREDADNNGEIQVLDLVSVSNHFGESW